MTDIKIADGDTIADSTGKFELLDGADTMLQRAWICADVPLGSFIYDRSLGADVQSVDFTSTAAKDRLELVLNEAVAKYDNTQIEVKEFGEKITLKITADGKSEIREVDYSGNI